MKDLDFFLLLLDNIGGYVILLLIICWIYYKAYKSYYLSLCDPWFVNQIFSVFASSVVLFLFYVGEISNFFFFQYWLTQFSFYLGFVSFKPVNLSTLSFKNAKTVLFKKNFIVAVYLFYVIVYALIYIKFGIPILLRSRLELFETTANTGGWGLLGRIGDFLSPILLFIAISRWNKKEEFLNCLIIVTVLATLLLSGSKSSFLLVVYVLFVYYLFYNVDKIKQVDRKMLKYFPVLFVIALAIIIVQNSVDNPFLLFVRRMIGSGDIFYYAYGNNTINDIQVDRVGFIVGDLLHMLRLYTPHQDVIGIQLMDLIYHMDTGGGPNSRHNVLGYVCFGFGGSILFSYLLGLLLSFVRHKWIYVMKNTFVNQMIYLYIYLAVVAVEIDISIFVTKVSTMLAASVSVFLWLIILLIVILMCFQWRRVVKKMFV